MTGLAVAAENEQGDVLVVVVPPLLDTGFVRVQSLLQEYRAASHNNHRQKSPWTELASQKVNDRCRPKGIIFLKSIDSTRCCARSVRNGIPSCVGALRRS